MPVVITANGSDDETLDQVATDGGYPVTHSGSTRNRIEQVAASAGVGVPPQFSDRNAIEWLAGVMEAVGILVYNLLQAAAGLVLSNENMTITYTTTGAGPGSMVAFPADGPVGGVAYDSQSAGQIRVDFVAPLVARTAGVGDVYTLALGLLTRAGATLLGPSLVQKEDGNWRVVENGLGTIADGLAAPPTYFEVGVDPVSSQLTLTVEGQAPQVVAYVPQEIVVAVEVVEYPDVAAGADLVIELSSTLPVVEAA
jgi:hypothetical protein